MKKHIFSFLVCICLISLFSVSVAGVDISYTDDEGRIIKLEDFIDTQGHWAHDAILKCADYGWISGYNGNFMPNAPIKRGDLALIFDRMLGLKTVSYNYFNDLRNDSYYRDAVLRCVAAGYINGTGTNTVAPEGFATREQVATIICRILKIDTSYTGNTGFVDDSSISAWAKPSVYAMKRLGYMNGNGSGYVYPTSNITRAELITLLNNVANTYIPKRDTTNQGNTFKNDFPTNVITSRNIKLVHSTIGRDLVLTQATNSLDLDDTVVKGRIVVLGKNSISLDNTIVSQIVLLDGKTSVAGMEKNVSEVYVGYYATESSLSDIPDKLVLESGTRVKIGSTMYENNTMYTKTYYGDELQANISNEQGYIAGGPKVSGVTFTQDENNNISVSNVKITQGEYGIKEVGVIWLSQNDNEDVIIPTYQNKDNYTLYKLDKYAEPFGFNVGKVKGMQAYRLYVKDNMGLYGYSDTKVFTEYGFNISLKIYDNNYPEKIDVEVIFQGDNIPDIGSVRLIHDVTELYSEGHNSVSMSLYSDSNAEYQPDPKKYKRYIVTISSERKMNNNTGEYEYLPSTSFGYIITFRNGNLINRFPVVNNALPSDISPVSEIITGTATYNGSTSVDIKNNKVTTRYAIPQEVGVVYRTSTAESISRPVAEANGWSRKKANVNLGLNDTVTYDLNIPISDNSGYTYYCSYVKMSNGYWYGTPQKILNSIQGDKDGPVLSYNPSIAVLSDTNVVITLEVQNLTADIDVYSEFIKNALCGNSVDGSLIGKSLVECNAHISNGSENDKKLITLQFRNLTRDAVYNLNLQVKDINGLKSNLLPISFNTKNMVGISLDKPYTSFYGGFNYKVNFLIEGCDVLKNGHYFVQNNGDGLIYIVKDGIDNYINIKGVSVENLQKTQVVIYFKYKPQGVYNKSFEFTRVFTLPEYVEQ